MKKSETVICFDPSDPTGMESLMDRYGDSKTMFVGKDEEGQSVDISIFPDKIVTSAFQANGWIRKNIYARDGVCEETVRAIIHSRKTTEGVIPMHG